MRQDTREALILIFGILVGAGLFAGVLAVVERLHL